MGFFANIHRDFTEEHIEQIIEEDKKEAERIAEEAERQREEYMKKEYNTIKTEEIGLPETERTYDSLETALRSVKDGGVKYLTIGGDVFQIQYLYTEQKGA